MSEAKLQSLHPLRSPKPPFMVAFFIGKEGVEFEPGKRVRLPAQGERRYSITQKVGYRKPTFLKIST